MSATRRPLIAGNWKMNGRLAASSEIEALAAGYDGPMRAGIDLLVCPPATLLHPFAALLAGSGVALGGQDCHPAASGAHTGDIAPEMLADLGASAVILGHSERRLDHQEGDAVVQAKVKGAWRAGLTAIVCVGESLLEREAGEAAAVVTRQVRQSVPDQAETGALVIAYEPIWAIGSGRTPTPGDVAEIHGRIRAVLSERFGAAGAGVRILYGGSVKPDNAGLLLKLDHVDGALVGGASLKAKEFLAIARSAL